MYLMSSMCFKGFSGGVQVKGYWELWGKQTDSSSTSQTFWRSPQPAYLQTPGWNNSQGGSEGQGKGMGQADASPVDSDLQVPGWEKVDVPTGKLAAEDA